MNEKIKQLDKLIHLQAEVLQTEIKDEYMFGLVNGLITAKSIILDEQQPLFQKIGNKYLCVKNHTQK